MFNESKFKLVGKLIISLLVDWVVSPLPAISDSQF
jgi:hypothetical protein